MEKEVLQNENEQPQSINPCIYLQILIFFFSVSKL